VEKIMLKKICVLGGTGFVGRHLLNRLAHPKLNIIVPSRRPERHRSILVLPNVQTVKADIHNQETLNQLVEGCDAVINLVGILNESCDSKFEQTHVSLVEKLVKACQTKGVSRVLHISALHADKNDVQSTYLKTKAQAERHLTQAKDLNVTIFRPSVMFGVDDSFFNRFALLLDLIPCCFPLACPNSKLAPVWVNDVTEAMAQSIENRETFGQSYNLCGTQTYTLKALVEFTAQMAGLKRQIIGLNDGLSKLQARFMEFVPTKPFSMDNYLSLQIDSVCSNDDFAFFNIQPASLEVIMPSHFEPTHQRAKYVDFRFTARR
jgi:NADH dehydrogenase